METTRWRWKCKEIAIKLRQVWDYHVKFQDIRIHLHWSILRLLNGLLFIRCFLLSVSFFLIYNRIQCHCTSNRMSCKQNTPSLANIFFIRSYSNSFELVQTQHIPYHTELYFITTTINEPLLKCRYITSFLSLRCPKSVLVHHFNHMTFWPGLAEQLLLQSKPTS